MAATTRATTHERTNREQSVVTRHGLRLPQAAILPLRQVPPGAPFAKFSATGLSVGLGQFAIHRPPAEKSHFPIPANVSAELAP
jgi:hypothetical protein